MFSFIINSVAIVIGSLIGLIFKKGIKKEYCDTLLKALGLIIIVLGIGGAIDNINLIEYGLIVVIICISIGTFIGEILKLDTKLNNFTIILESKFKKGKISEGFISSTTLFCVGAMAIIGTMNACFDDPSTIYVKSLLDFITSIILASTLGFGVMISSIGVLLYQGLLTLIFMLLKTSIEFETATLFATYLNAVGYIMIVGIGINFFMKEKIKIVNMLPSLILISIYFGVTLWLG